MYAILCAMGAWAQQDTAKSEALYDQGVRFYEQKDYQTAIRLWEQAYALAPVPELLFNIAKACEEANEPAQALDAWRRYREVASAEEIATASARIAELELIVAALQPAEAEPEPEPVVVLPEPVLPEPVPARSKARLSRGWVVGLMGAGAVGTVAAGSWLAQSAAGDATALAEGGCLQSGASTLCDASTTAGLRSERAWMMAGVGLASGGLALGAGSVLVAVTKPSSSDVVMLQVDGSF